MNRTSALDLNNVILAHGRSRCWKPYKSKLHRLTGNSYPMMGNILQHSQLTRMLTILLSGTWALASLPHWQLQTSLGGQYDDCSICVHIKKEGRMENQINTLPRFVPHFNTDADVIYWGSIVVASFVRIVASVYCNILIEALYELELHPPSFGLTWRLDLQLTSEASEAYKRSDWLGNSLMISSCAGCMTFCSVLIPHKY